MSGLTISTHIEAPSEVVFDVFADIEKASERVDGIVKIEKLTDGEVGFGTRFRETRIMFKRAATEELEFTQFDAGKSYTVGCQSCGCECSTCFAFVSENAGTRVNMELRTRPLTFVAKLMSPLGVLFSGSMKKCMTKDMEQLKAVAESKQGERA